MHRVKLYKLNTQGLWDDKGTGHVAMEYLPVRLTLHCFDQYAACEQLPSFDVVRSRNGPIELAYSLSATVITDRCWFPKVLVR